jgi:predicted nucleic acid-binding Zn ribbon protein
MNLSVIPVDSSWKSFPTHIDGSCKNCGETEATFKKVLSASTFHLKGGGVGWGANRYSSGAEKGTDVVELDEP